MQKLFDEVGSFDRRCYEKFSLSEDVLMEHAAMGMARYIRAHFIKDSQVLIVCGSGSNGADGMALARLLECDYGVSIYFAKKPKSNMAKLQAKRAHSLGVRESLQIKECDVLVDAYLGTGFIGSFDKKSRDLLQKMNACSAFKIACDTPSGLQGDAQPAKESFMADVTLSMGALKKSLFLDAAKDFVGEIEVVDLGLSRQKYEKNSNWHLLEFEDMKLPYRAKKDSHKGSYGHLALISGEKAGATVLSAQAALRFGAGLVTLVGLPEVNTPASLMHSHLLPKNATALAIGMGLGTVFSKKELGVFLNNSLPLLADADILYMPEMLNILKREQLVLTPHPKEFVALLALTEVAYIEIAELQERRFYYVEQFCKKYPKLVLLLKGANVIIGKANQFFINPYGISSLAKGGSGDILSGLIAALLAQGYETLDATLTASLAHTKLAQNYKGADFSLTPDDLIDAIGNL